MRIEKLSKHSLEYIKDFDCGDEDLNDFILRDSFIYEEKLLAKTYLVFIDEKGLIGYFSLLNDKIQKSDDISKSEWNKKIKEDLSYKKNSLLELPSLKVGRLAVDKNFQKKQYGGNIVSLLKKTFSSENNRTGCKYITVDSYKKSKKFYERQGFKIYPAKTKDRDTILMYFNLSKYIKEIK